MSEDCDFRMRLKDGSGQFSKEYLRKALRKFRYEIIDALRGNDFAINDSDIRVRTRSYWP